MNDYIKVDHIATDRLIVELERRAREEPGAWTHEQQRRVWTLAQSFLPQPKEKSNAG